MTYFRGGHVVKKCVFILNPPPPIHVLNTACLIQSMVPVMWNNMHQKQNGALTCLLYQLLESVLFFFFFCVIPTVSVVRIFYYLFYCPLCIRKLPLPINTCYCFVGCNLLYSCALFALIVIEMGSRENC